MCSCPLRPWPTTAQPLTMMTTRMVIATAAPRGTMTVTATQWGMTTATMTTTPWCNDHDHDTTCSAMPMALHGTTPATPCSVMPATPYSAMPATPCSAMPTTLYGAMPATPCSATPATPRGAMPMTPHMVQRPQHHAVQRLQHHTQCDTHDTAHGVTVATATLNTVLHASDLL